MKNTEQKSLRLSLYHLRIVEELQTDKGYTFTEAIKHIISEYNKIQNNDNHIKLFFQKLDKRIKDINPSAAEDPMLNSSEFLDGLNEIGENIRLALNALMIIGSANSRTAVEIETLFGLDE